MTEPGDTQPGCGRKGKAGCDASFWADDVDMGDRIELIIWTNFDLYEENALFLSKDEALGLIEKLRVAVKELDAFLVPPTGPAELSERPNTDPSPTQA